MAKQSLQTLLRDGQRIGERIKLQRQRLQLTQDGLAKKADLSRSALVHYEQGNALPGGLELIKLAWALETTPNLLLSGSESFFALGAPEFSLAGVPDEQLVASVAMSFQAVDRPFKEAVSALLMAYVRTKLTKQEFVELTDAIKVMPEVMAEHVPQLEEIADKTGNKFVRASRRKSSQ